MQKASREFGAETPKAPLAVSSKPTHMNNLTRFENDGIEIFIDPQGKSFSSIRGVARMAVKGESTIRDFITARKIDVINVKIPTATGLKTARLLSESSICKVLREYNPDRLEQFAIIGIQTALHQIAGYQQQTTAPGLEVQTIYDLKPWQIEKLCVAAQCTKEGYPLEPDCFEGIDELFWDIPWHVINWLQSVHESIITQAIYHQCLLSGYLAESEELQDFVLQYEADSGIRDRVEAFATKSEIDLYDQALQAKQILEFDPFEILKPSAAQKLVDGMLESSLADLGVDIRDVPSLIAKPKGFGKSKN
jgi:hypothetical protein